MAMRPTHVLHCMWKGEIGGAERAVFQLVREQLSDPAIEPAILFGQPGGHYWDAAKELGCPVVSANLEHGAALGGVRRAAGMMRRYDIHHLHTAEPLLMLASSACRGALRVYTHRGGWIDYRGKQGLRYDVVGWFLRHRFHAVSGNTAHAARSAARLYKLDESRVAVTYNGIDFDLLEAERTRDAVRAELGFGGSEYILGTSANLKPWKRIDRLVEAVAAAKDERMRLLVVGDGVERARLEVLAASRGVHDRVAFVGMKANVADYLQVMDLFALPSLGLESFGNAAVEAMSFGVPTIVFADGGGVVEHIESGRTGFVVNNQEELLQIVVQLIDDRDRGRAIGASGREFVRGRYTPERAAQAYASLYASAGATVDPSNPSVAVAA